MKPCDADFFTWHGRIEGILTQFRILLFIAEGADSALDRKDEIFLLVALEGVSTADFSIPLELNDGVFQAACLEGDDGCRTNEELVLDDTARLEQARHQAEVSATIDESTVCEEFFRRGPEALRVLLLQVPHAVCTLSRVRIVHVARATDEELHLLVIQRDDMLGNIKNEMDALLRRDTTHEGEKSY